MTRLHAEIARSINFHRTTQGGTTPMRILICGGGTGLPYMTEFFAEKLQAPVEYFNPLRNVQAGPDALAQGIAHCSSGIGELVGCALRALKDCPIEINLTPPGVRRSQRFAKRLPALVVATLFFILTPALCWLDIDEAAKRISEKVAAQTAEVARLEKLSKEISTSLAEREKLVSQAAPFLAVAAEKSAWASIMEELAATIPNAISGSHRSSRWKESSPFLSPHPPLVQKRHRSQPRLPQLPKAITAIEINGLYLDIPQNAGRSWRHRQIFCQLETLFRF
jgi:hypothetical protein